MCVVSLSGSLTGRVGDFGLGLTNPVGEALIGAGFLPAVVRVAFGVEDLDGGFVGCATALSGVLLVGLWCEAVGVTEGLAVVLLFAEMCVVLG